MDALATAEPQALAAGAVVKVADTVDGLRGMDMTGASPSWTAILQGCLASSDGGGGVFYWDGLCRLADDTGLTLKPGAFADDAPGRWRRIYSGPVNVKWFGAKGDRSSPSTDDTEPINRAIAASHWVFLPAGTYYVTRLFSGNQTMLRLTGAGASPYGADPRTVIAAYSSSQGPLVQISDETVNGAPISVQLEDISVDGVGATGGAALVGIQIVKGHDIRLKNVFVTNCATGIYASGSSGELQTRLMNVLLDGCFTTNNSLFGTRIEPLVPQGAFSNFTLLNCSSEGDGTGFRIANAVLASLTSCEAQDYGTCGLEVAASTVSVTGTYLESGRPGAVTLRASDSCRVIASGSNISGPRVDGSSVVESHGCAVVAGSVESSTPSRLGQLSEPSSTSWGPPNIGPLGAVYPSGFTYTDRQGTEWTCVVPGTSGNSAFIARGGRIVVTVDHSKLLNGNMLWYPQRDFLVERVSLVVTETLVGTAPDLTLTTLLDSRGDDLIVAPISQGQVAAGTVITAAENPRTYARLTGGRAFRMKGTKPSEVSSLPIPALGDRLAVFTHGAWTQGAALLIIEGSYLAYA